VRAILALIVGACCCRAEDPAALIEAGHWKRARAVVEQRIQAAPNDADANFFMSQIRAAFGDRAMPLPLAEKALRLGPGVAKYHRQLAEVQGVMAQHANVFQQALLARRFRKELDAALGLDARDVQAWRDLLEYYLLAPGIIGGDVKKAVETAARIAAIDPVEGALGRARVAEYRKDGAEQGRELRRALELGPQSYKARIAAAEYFKEEALAREAIATDGGRSDAYGVLAAIYAGRERWNELDAVLASAAENVPDDAWPYFRAAEQLLHTPRAERYLHIYLSQEQEGNRPTAAEARRKLARGAGN